MCVLCVVLGYGYEHEFVHIYPGDNIVHNKFGSANTRYCTLPHIPQLWVNPMCGLYPFRRRLDDDAALLRAWVVGGETARAEERRRIANRTEADLEEEAHQRAEGVAAAQVSPPPPPPVYICMYVCMHACMYT